MKKLFHSILIMAFGILIGVSISIVSAPPRGRTVSLRPAPTPAPLLVHVIGAVVEPGVYELPPGSRLQHAVAAAGGLRGDADTSGLNLAQRLQDGSQVSVPKVIVSEPGNNTRVSSGEAPPGKTQTPSTTDSLININSASQAQLETLPGIGPATAEKIIEYRETNGPFETIADIVNVSGIGPATYDKIKDSITTGN